MHVPAETVHLNLSSNSLSDVEGLSGLSFLKTLDLSDNKFTQLGDSAFKDLPKLETLNLKFNQKLRIVDDYAFFSLPKDLVYLLFTKLYLLGLQILEDIFEASFETPTNSKHHKIPLKNLINIT